ncbi:hypothetical protein [Alcanivorax sp. 1008]|uniref:hypothetical protein n=1 Tax=Alcanivorax sp. 1008 TaxID=2816853 RepID=UPI001D52C2DB|nr:hypothetical protein [Alcanivorax sp. 1008]MCC1496854.1 hypothetical protein [Alcanivorax sp. 1008]
MKESRSRNYLQGHDAIAMALALEELTSLPIGEVRVAGTKPRVLHIAAMVGRACFLDARGMQSLSASGIDGWDPAEEYLEMTPISRARLEEVKASVGPDQLRAAKRYAKSSPAIRAAITEAERFITSAQGSLPLPVSP